MGLSRRQFTKEFKLAAVRRLEQGVSIAEVARGVEVSPNVLHRWRREFREGPGNVFPGNGKQRWSEGRIAELERKIGQQTVEIDFLKGCLQRIEEQRMLQALTLIFAAADESIHTGILSRFPVGSRTETAPSPRLGLRMTRRL